MMKSFLWWDSHNSLIILTSVCVSTGARQQCYWELWFPVCWDRRLPVGLLSVCLLSKPSSSLLLCFYTVLTCLSSLFPVSDVFFLSLSLSPSLPPCVSPSLVSMAPRDLQVSVQVWCLLCSHWLLIFQIGNLFQVSLTCSKKQWADWIKPNKPIHLV